MRKSKRQDTKSDRSNRDTVRELKGIVSKLRKEVRQLRRELGKREDVSDDYKELLEEVEIDSPAIDLKKTHNCPECSQEITELDLGQFIILTCTSCSWRQRKRDK